MNYWLLVTHLPVLSLPTYRLFEYSAVLTWRLSGRVLIIISSVLNQSFVYVCFDWFEHPTLVFDGKLNICTFNCAKKSTASCGGEKRIYNQSSWFEVVYFHLCFPVVAFLFSIGVPGCAGLSFTIKPPFPSSQCSSPSLLPCSPLPSIINVIVSRVGRRQWRGQGGRSECNRTTVTHAANRIQRDCFRRCFFPLSLFFFSLFCSCLAPLTVTPLSQGGPFSLSSSSYFAWFVVFVCVCVRAGGGFGRGFGSSFDQ